MYIPILKSRMYENILLNRHKDLFNNESIIPFIEVINLKISRREFEEDSIITYYDSIIDNKYFIDYFTFSDDEYDKYDLNQLQLAIEIRDEYSHDYFKDLLANTKLSNKAIPVVSIKSIREDWLKGGRLSDIVKDLQAMKNQIAIRISAELFDKYYGSVNELLRKDDYLFFDINEEVLESYYYQLRKLKNANEFNKILINSPRKARHTNGTYENHKYTKAIDNSLLINHKKEGFDGYGDYLGTKNELPVTSGGGMGVALALMYDHSVNKFYSIANDDVKEGITGYRYVIDELLKKDIENKLNPYGDCPAYDLIKTMKLENRTGSWASWKKIPMLRYISEVNKLLNENRNAIDLE